MAVLRKASSGVLSPPLSLLPLLPPSSSLLKLDYFGAYTALVQHPNLSQEGPGASSASVSSG